MWLCFFTCFQRKRDIAQLLLSAELKPRGCYFEHFRQADLGYFGQAIIGVKVQKVATWLLFGTEEYRIERWKQKKNITMC